MPKLRFRSASQPSVARRIASLATFLATLKEIGRSGRLVKNAQGPHLGGSLWVALLNQVTSTGRSMPVVSITDRHPAPSPRGFSEGFMEVADEKNG